MGISGRPYVICHMLPSVDGRIVEGRRAPARRLELISIDQRDGDIVWLRYKVRR